jgi:4-amino-4-deoxy-L-arabinose transferase-like glycosyltransferase
VPPDGPAGCVDPQRGSTAAGNRRTISRRATLLGIGLAVVTGLVVRLRFLTVPLVTDEAGYAQVARLWSRGDQLYGDHAWIERPQGLLLAYRVVAASGWGPMARVLAMVAASIATVAVAAAAWALAGRRAAVLAAALFAVLSPAPHLEGFTANGELLATAATTSAVALGAWWSVNHDQRLLLLAGIAASTGVLTKQAAVDGLVAVGALVLADAWRRRRNPLRDLVVFASGAAVPLALAFLHGLAIGLDDWWFAVASHRTQMDSLINGLYDTHRAEFFQSLGPFRRDLGLLMPLAVVGLVAVARRHRLTLPLVWLLTATFGVAVGGVFHPHYWVQVAAPLALLAALGLDLVATRWRAAARVLGAVALVVPLAYSIPVYTARTADRVSELTSADPRHVAAQEVGEAVAAITEPDERVAVLWTNAAIYWYADRASPFRHMWFAPLRDFEGAAEIARATIIGPGPPPAAIVVATEPTAFDPDGQIARLLARRYRLVDVVAGNRIYRLRPALPEQPSVP